MPMAKSKRKKGRPATRAATRPTSRAMAWGRRAGRRDRRWNYALLALVVLGLGYGAYAWQQASLDEESFLALAERGQQALARVESIPSRGRDHLSPGESHSYPSRFPTTGPHAQTPTQPGVYTQPGRPTALVHALEHGNIVIYYDQPGEQAMQQLKDWAGLYDGQWSGLILTPSPDLGEALVLTAWTRRLELDAFEPTAAAAFIDAYRGRGPEHPVR